MTLAERFWSRVNKTDGCWEWTAAKNRDGYGRFRVDGHRPSAHQASRPKLSSPNFTEMSCPLYGSFLARSSIR